VVIYALTNYLLGMSLLGFFSRLVLDRFGYVL